MWSKFKGLMIWFLFLGSFGFSGGGYILLFLVVPLEEFLVRQGWRQGEIDQFLSYVVYGWVLFGFVLSVIYYFYLYRKKRLIGIIVLLLMMANAAFVFYLFVNTDSAVIAMTKGEVDQSNERFTFGPYPDEEEMKRLKEEGYDGIITLLSPSLVFEKTLLEQEKEAGEKQGVSIHSFPMLPWIGDNKSSLEGIRSLIQDYPEGKFYIHCYLGKHRVDMARDVIMDEAGLEEKEGHTILPSDFERGNVYSFEEERIVVGPFPTDEEWFILFRQGITEIVSILDPSDKWAKRVKDIAAEEGLKVTFLPLDSKNPDPTSLKKIVNYAKNAQHGLYIHGFKDSNSLYSLDFLFRTGNLPITPSLYPQINELVGTGIALSSVIPDAARLEMMKESGVLTVVTLGTATPGLEQQVNEAGMKFEQMDATELGALYTVARTLTERTDPVHVYVADSQSLPVLRKMVTGMLYGLKKSSLDGVGSSGGSATVIDRDLVVGPVLNEKEWPTVIVENGVKRILFLYAASLHTKEEVESLERMAGVYGLAFEVVPMYESYQEELIKRFTNKDVTTYIVVPDVLKEEVIHGIRISR